MKTLKYLDTQVVFREVPGETTLAINLTGCPFRCKGCHSPWLRRDEGEPLTFYVLDELIRKNPGITCVSFMGGDSLMLTLRSLYEYSKNKYPKLKLCWYSGQDPNQDGIAQRLRENGILQFLDYAKFGPYVEELGPLDSVTTNQRFFRIKHKGDDNFELEDCTSLFHAQR